MVESLAEAEWFRVQGSIQEYMEQIQSWKLNPMTFNFDLDLESVLANWWILHLTISLNFDLNENLSKVSGKGWAENSTPSIYRWNFPVFPGMANKAQVVNTGKFNFAAGD